MVTDFCRAACVVSTTPNSCAAVKYSPLEMLSLVISYSVSAACTLPSIMIFWSLSKVSVEGHVGWGLEPPDCGRSFPTQTIL